MKKKFLAFAAAACFTCSSIAETITFDGLSSSVSDGVQIQNGYSNLQWDNFYVLNANEYVYNPSGYQNGIVSGDKVAYNGWENPATISSNQLFTLTSAYFTAAWSNGLTINVEGFGTHSYNTSFTVDTFAPTNILFNWTGLSAVKFSTIDGIHNDDFGGRYGSHFAMDNLVIDSNNSSVPEPSALALIALALCGLGFIRRRKA